MKYIKYPCLGFVIKEINFTENKKHYLIYSADDEDLKMVSTDKVLELERPNDGTLFFYKKRIKSILKSFICTYTGLVMDDDISNISELEEGVKALTNKLFI